MRQVEAWLDELKSALTQLATASPVYGRPVAARRVARALMHLGGSPYARRVVDELRDAAEVDAGAALVLRMLAGRVSRRAEPVRSPVPVGIRYTAGPGC